MRKAELPEGAIVVSNAYELPVHCFGRPKAVHFVATASAKSLAGLRDTSSHLFCYEQTAESRASVSWWHDAREKLHRELLAKRVAKSDGR